MIFPIVKILTKTSIKAVKKIVKIPKIIKSDKEKIIKSDKEK